VRAHEYSISGFAVAFRNRCCSNDEEL